MLGNELDDKLLTCVDCGREFVFSKGEQFFFASKGLCEPKRCPECRKRRKATIAPGNKGVRNEW